MTGEVAENALVSVLLVVIFLRSGRDWRRDDVFLRSPIAKVDQFATLAAKGHEFATGSNFFLANRTLHAVRIGKGLVCWNGIAAISDGSPINSPTRS